MLRYLAVLLLASLAQSTAAQENYPSRQITLIAPFAAGGSTDLVARVVSEGLRAKLGQPVIVENKPGGTGLIGAREVVKADPDGYTLLLANAGATVIPAAMSNNYPIDLNKDLLYRARFFGHKFDLSGVLHVDFLPGETRLARAA